MLTDQTKIELEKAAAAICKGSNLPHAYFTQKFGRRRHYIAGYGKGTFTKTHHQDFTDNIALSWEGTMTDGEIRSALRCFTDLLHQAAQELAQP